MRRAGEERRRATSPLAVQTYKYRTEELLMYPFPRRAPAYSSVPSAARALAGWRSRRSPGFDIIGAVGGEASTLPGHRADTYTHAHAHAHTAARQCPGAEMIRAASVLS